MDDAEYREQIRQAYLGELGGVALGEALLERGQFTADQRWKIRTFMRLEGHVAEALLPVVQRLKLDVADTAALRDEVRVRAVAMANWQRLIVYLGRELQPYIDEYAQLLANARPADRSALRLLVEHEQALTDFGRAELEGEGQRSIQYLLRLLPNGDAGQCADQ